MTKLGKAEAREQVKNQLNALSNKDYSKNSSIIGEHLRAFIMRMQEDREIHTILSYSAMDKWHEVTVSFLDKEFRDIQFNYVSRDRLAPFPSRQYGLILVPLFGFNSHKFRLGHGGGWYDRFLSSQPKAMKVGVGLKAGYIEFETDSHDVQMDAIITENGIFKSHQK